jgi:hypothetical protein
MILYLAARPLMRPVVCPRCSKPYVNEHLLLATTKDTIFIPVHAFRVSWFGQEGLVLSYCAWCNTQGNRN